MARTQQDENEAASAPADEDVTTRGGTTAVAPDNPVPTSRADVVTYHGKATVRRISAAQWDAAGAEGQSACEWNRRNDYTLPATGFSEKALQVLRGDGSFSVPAAGP